MISDAVHESATVADYEDAHPHDLELRKTVILPGSLRLSYMEIISHNERWHAMR